MLLQSKVWTLFMYKWMFSVWIVVWDGNIQCWFPAGHVSRWRGHSDRSGRRDSALLECLQQNQIYQGINRSRLLYVSISVRYHAEILKWWRQHPKFMLHFVVRLLDLLHPNRNVSGVGVGKECGGGKKIWRGLWMKMNELLNECEFRHISYCTDTVNNAAERHGLYLSFCVAQSFCHIAVCVIDFTA